MKNLNNISSTKFANSVMDEIDQNFTDVKSAIDELEANGGGSSSSSSPKYKNNERPFYKDTFKILGLGNSFTLYPTRPLETLLSNAAGFDKTKFVFKFSYIQGYSLAQYVAAIENNTTPPLGYYSAGGGSLPVTTSGGLRSVLSQDWDIIVIQQKSTDAKNYSTYVPYLTQLVNLIRTYCTNPKVCIAWHQTWSVNQGTYAEQDAEWTNICKAVKSVIGVNGIDVVIPSGTALQNARHSDTFLNTTDNPNHYLLMDDTGHPADGAGRYVCACAWYQALFAPLLGLPSIVGNSAILTATDTANKQYPDAIINVTNANKEILQQCAMAACTDMFHIMGVPYSSEDSGGGSSGGGGITEETDPIFKASPAYGITNSKITKWDGQYTKPSSGIPASDLEGNIPTSKINGLASVATSGSYNDLKDKPTIPVVEVQDIGDVSQSLAANTFYKFTGTLTSLTLALTAGTGLVVYAGKFTSDSSTACTLSLPASVTEAPNNPAIEAGKTYEFNIADNVLLMVEV